MLRVELPHVKHMLSFRRVFGLKGHCYSVHAVSFPSRGRPILKHMTKVTLALFATNLQEHTTVKAATACRAGDLFRHLDVLVQCTSCRLSSMLHAGMSIPQLEAQME